MARKLIELNRPFKGSTNYITFAKSPDSEDWTHLYFCSALDQSAAESVVRSLAPQELSVQVTQESPR